MPVYEYKCQACDAAFEELVLSEAAAKKIVCPQCGGRKIERVPSVFAAHAATSRTPACAASGMPLPRGGCGHCGDAGMCPMAGQ